MKYKLNTLPNGLKIIIVPISGFKSATVMVMVGVGSRYEEKNINGISHFLEHMAFKGTKKRPSALAISSLIDGIGGESNAFTSKDHTGYYIKAASERIPLLIDVLSDMLLNSIFSPSEIEKEKGVIIEEINMYEDIPMRKVGDIYENLLYGDTSLGRDISGTKDAVKSIRRKDFIDYIDKFYSPSNTVVAVAGGADSRITNHESRITDLLEKYLGKWKDKKVNSPAAVDEKQDKPQVLIKYKDTKQAHLVLGVRAYKIDHPSRYPLSVLTTTLGGGMSSRLFSEVREKRGLAYYVRAETNRYVDVGNFAAQAGVDVERIDSAIKVILEELEKIAQEPVSEEEIAKAKEYIRGRLTLSLEDSKSVASLYGVSQLIEGRIRTPDQIMEKIDAVTPKQVQKVARDIFRQEKLNLAVIGPYKEYKDEAKFKNLLRLN